ncbi:ABC transporter ATP-binding protein [Eubacterium sp. AB3007]|uniref:ABC transporter ATP-binding protein n=1 Tax=Eubacterium sp. AB3007 TaxID=1392487 RepID=UPI0004864A19|nr:ABC transporter ATP-binding protein [Eubacterium sp. AB3007]
MDRNSYISLDNLSVGYSGQALIRDICLDIRKGEIVAMIGPNGAGKSTILKTITRQLAKIRGGVSLEGRDIHRIPYAELSRKMAVVLTERLKTELLTCYDIVASGRYPYTGRLGVLRPEDEAMVDTAIAAVNATELGPRDFNAISDGQRQRILLARAICQDPELIILDEPTSFLDVRYKLELLSILRNMAKEKGITVIMSLHEIDLAEKIADKVICVKGDHIYRYGSPEEIFEENMIRDLYEIDNGFFDPLFGSIELPAPNGKGWGYGAAEAPGSAVQDAPDVFVISSCGTGIPVYRKLQKENRSFATGILYENDVDFRLARLLAREVITERPFEEISDAALERAKELIRLCGRVIYAEFPRGTANRRVEELLQLAQSLGKLEKI